jgi:hypothetical protein
MRLVEDRGGRRRKEEGRGGRKEVLERRRKKKEGDMKLLELEISPKAFKGN